MINFPSEDDRNFTAHSSLGNSILSLMLQMPARREEMSLQNQDFFVKCSITLPNVVTLQHSLTVQQNALDT